MTATPDGGLTLNDSKSNLALTKSTSSSAAAAATADHATDAEKLPPVPSPPSFPEGGMQAWLTVLGGYVSGSCQSSSELLIPLASQVHDTLLHLWYCAVIWCIPSILLGEHFPQPTHNLSPIYISLSRRITFRDMPQVTSAGLVQCKHSSCLLEVYFRGNCLMRGWCLVPLLSDN